MTFRNKFFYIITGFTVLTLSACINQKYTGPTANADKLYRNQNSTDTVNIADLP